MKTQERRRNPKNTTAVPDTQSRFGQAMKYARMYNIPQNVWPTWNCRLVLLDKSPLRWLMSWPSAVRQKVQLSQHADKNSHSEEKYDKLILQKFARFSKQCCWTFGSSGLWWWCCCWLSGYWHLGALRCLRIVTNCSTNNTLNTSQKTRSSNNSALTEFTS